MSDNLKGVLLALAGAAGFSVVIAMAKVALEDYHLFQVLFFRQVAVLVFIMPALVRSFPGSLQTRRPVVHGIRLVAAFLALVSGIAAVSFLPLTTAATLSFAKVFFVALLALYFLSEPVGRHRLSAVVVGFIGVLVVMRPGVEGFLNAYTLIPLAGAAGAAVATVCVRSLSQTESTATLMAFQAISVGVMAGVPLFWLWETPDGPGLMLLCSMGALAAVSNWLGVTALRLGEASVVGMVEYSKLIYAGALGYVLFHELPDRYTLIGAAIIIGSSVYIFHREARLKSLGQPSQD